MNLDQMEGVSACRACLATDVRLYCLYKYDLKPAFENLTGLQISNIVGWPQQICTFCATLLLKFAAFRQKCIAAHNLLSYAIVEEHQITANYIYSLDRQSHNLTLPFTTTSNFISIKQEDLSIESDFKSLLHNIIEKGDVKVEESSDEEPLAKFVKKSNKRKKKCVVKGQEQNLVQTQDHKQISVIKAEIEDDLSPMPFDECYNDNDDDQYDEDSKPEFVCDDQIEMVVLSHEQQMQELQARKNTLNYMNSFYKCELCYKGFMVENTYRNHMERHAPSFGRFSCDICQLRFPSSRTQQQHKLATHSRNYICRRCGHICKAKSRAKEHYKWHQGVLYVCDICGAAFDKPTSHLTHVRTNHPSRHICPVCGVSFVSENGLRMHARKAHRTASDQVLESAPEFKCVCGVQFKCSAAFDKHLSLADDNVCDPTLRPCIFCGESFLNEEQLRRHAIVHQEDKSYDCVECKKSFNSARYQAAHYKRVHSRLSVRPQRNKLLSNAVCEICGKKCTSKATLVYHQRTHSGEKPYQCNECPKRFSILQRLQIHTRTHTGERPCQCPHCPKAFKHKAALNRHVRVHTGVKPYSCPHCGKSFSQSNSMKGHVRSVHLKLPALYRRPRGEYEEGGI